MALLDWVKKKAARSIVMTAPPPATQGVPTLQPSGATEVTDRYDNKGEIARGGMGAILRVVDRGLRRTVAMKVLEPADGVKDDVRAGLFVEEAQITSQLDHPNICPIHEYGRDTTGVHYFTMKLVKGKTLSDLVHAPGYDPSDPRALREAIDVLRRVCDALAFAHAKGVLHRDLKPDNIMVGDFGQVYLMDWGIALLVPPAADEPAVANLGRVTVSRQGASPTTAAGTIVGTLMYMPPEQARGDVVDARADVFGLGAVLYEILTQVPPYYAQQIGDLVLMAQGAGWRPPQDMVGIDIPLPAALCAICEKAMQEVPANRYQTVLEFKAALDEFLVGGMSFPTLQFASGHCIINEGEPGDKAYVIQRGYCRVYKVLNGEQVALADLGPGEVFGETAVFASSARTATIQALTDVTVQVVSHEVFEKDLGMASTMGAFVKAVAQRFVATDQQLRALQHEVSQVALARERAAGEAWHTQAQAAELAQQAQFAALPPQQLQQMARVPLPPSPSAPASSPSPSPSPSFDAEALDIDVDERDAPAQTAASETATSKTSTSETTASGTTASETTAPLATAPSTAAPAATAPTETASETTAPAAPSAPSAPAADVASLDARAAPAETSRFTLSDASTPDTSSSESLPSQSGAPSATVESLWPSSSSASMPVSPWGAARSASSILGRTPVPTQRFRAPPPPAVPAAVDLPVPPSPSESAPPFSTFPPIMSGSPFALIDAVVRLQALADRPADTGALLLEALVRGTQALSEERARAASSAHAPSPPLLPGG